MYNHILKIAEDIEGLPSTTDPYAPMKRINDKPESVDDKPEDIGNKPEDINIDELLGKPDLEKPDDLGGLDPDKDISQEMPYWEPVETKNKKDIAFKRSDGFTLRARQYASVPGKWIAQLHSKDKLLDWGNLFIPNNVKPDEYLQKMSDYMLDKNSLRYDKVSKQETPPLDIETPDETLEEPGAYEEIGLDDENIDLA